MAVELIVILLVVVMLIMFLTHHENFAQIRTPGYENRNLTVQDTIDGSAEFEKDEIAFYARYNT